MPLITFELNFPPGPFGRTPFQNAMGAPFRCGIKDPYPVTRRETEYAAPYGACDFKGPADLQLFRSSGAKKCPGFGPDMSKSGGQFSMDRKIL